MKAENEKNEQYQRVILEKLIRELYVFHKEGVEGEDICRYFSGENAFMENGKSFITILIKPDKKEEFQPDQIREIGRQLAEEGMDFVWLAMPNQGIGILEGSNSELLSIYQQNEAARMVREWNRKYAQEYGTISAGISRTHGRNEFYIGYEQAQRALDLRFYEGCASIVLCPAKEMKHEIPDNIAAYVKQNEINFREMNQEKEREYLKKLEMMFCQNPVKRDVFIKFFLDVYWRMCRKNGVPDSAGELSRELEKCSYAKDCVDQVIAYHNAHICEKMAIYGTEDKNYSYTVSQAVSYIREHFREPLTVEEVARTVGKSANYFSSIFKKETGYSFTNYVTRMRMEQAKWLLLHTGMQISEICEQVGYTDYIYFSQLFRQQFGCSASKLRKEHERNF